MDYVADAKKYSKNVNEAAVDGIVKYCGIALRSRDAATIACSQKKELDSVREKFLKKKLALTAADGELDKAIEEVCEAMGKGNRSKSRASFYYLLAEKYGKLDLFVKK